jgi:hypothetical protein
MGGAGETRKGFLVLETNYKVYAYTCESRQPIPLVCVRQRLICDWMCISQRAGDRHLEPIYRYSDAISESDRWAVRKGYCQGGHEERDHRGSGA